MASALLWRSAGLPSARAVLVAPAAAAPASLQLLAAALRRHVHVSARAAAPAEAAAAAPSSSSSPSSSSPSSSSGAAGAEPTTRRRAYDAAAERRIAGIYYDPEVAARLTARERQVFSTLADEPPTPLMADHGFLYQTSEEQLARHLAAIAAAAAAAGAGGAAPPAVGAGGADTASAIEMVRRALSTRTGSLKEATSFRKAELMKKFAGKPFDTGDSRVQVAMLTERIQRVSAHLSSNKKDMFSKRALTSLTVRRRKVLEYMTRRDYQGYRVAVKELSLRPVPLVYDRHLPKLRVETHVQINERNRRLKNRVSRGHKGH